MDPDSGIAGLEIKPDETYIEVFVESMRLAEGRRFATQFNGMIYSFISFARAGEATAEMASVTKPGKLAELDPKNLDRVITVENKLLGAVPWRGGTLGLELGLFSVKSVNLMSPILDYVTRVSEAGGISFVGKIKPFLPLITEGLDLIAGQTQNVAIEVALDADLTLVQSEYIAIVACKRGQIAPADVTLDPADRQLLVKGKPLKDGYCVLSLRATPEKADYGEIPELASAYTNFRDEMKSGKRKNAEEAKQALRVAIYTSPDLIESDKDRLVALNEKEFNRIFTGGPIGGHDVAPPPETLYGLKLYGSW
ncbi:hypothetical protein [uncultured Ruegeria sp.]|uniref:hypothetical protein n=2 Tax=uncultured Ruegeria sp. TaxID=259304 RepID=UPI002616F000|nr:hypothetical protein [uncultured Ruegeria sp.]